MALSRQHGAARAGRPSRSARMANELRDKGIAIANEAVQHDNAQRYDEAIKGYIKAAEYLLTATKYEKNPVTLKTIRDKCVEYTVRAELLNKSLVVKQTVANGLALLAAQAPLEPGQLLEDVRLTVRGILRARRDHSASISFLELSDSSDEAEQMLQVCINRAKCDDTPITKHALEQLNIGDTLCCYGPPGRTRTDRAEPTLFARSIALVRATREPVRVLRLLAAWRAGELGIDETSRALGAEPSTLRALLPALGPVLAASRRGAEAQQQRARPASEESDGEAGPVVPRVAPARLERLREVAARRQAGLVLVMEEIRVRVTVTVRVRAREP